MATSDHNVLYMCSDVSKEMSRFRLPSSGRRRLLLRVPTNRRAENQSPSKILLQIRLYSELSRTRNPHVIDYAKNICYAGIMPGVPLRYGSIVFKINIKNNYRPSDYFTKPLNGAERWI